jgi:hypothetical protein
LKRERTERKSERREGEAEWTRVERLPLSEKSDEERVYVTLH